MMRLISWSYFRKHVLRSLLTVAGIVLGVAVFVGMRAANNSVRSAFAQTIERIAGRTQLQITAGESGFGEDVLDRVQAASTVRVAVPALEVIVDSNIAGEGNLFILGVDMTGDRSLRDYDVKGGDEGIDDPLIFLAQPDSLMLSRSFADRNHLSSNSRLRLGTSDGQKTFVVRGIMNASGLASAFGGNIAVMDIYAVQKMFGRGRTFDRIDVAVKDGVTLAQCQAELRQLLGPGFDVQPPAGRGQQFEAMLGSYSTMVSLSSLFALLIGMFIIYNAFAIAVAERRSEIGILRALGATRAQISRLFLKESAIMGVIGSAGGLVLGVAIAKGIAVVIGSLLSDVYRITQIVDEVDITPQLLAFAFGIGLVTTLFAATVPALNAARVDPIHALQKGRFQLLSATEGRRRLVAAIALALLALACITLAHSRVVFYGGYVAATIAVLLLAPLLTLGLAKVFRGPLKVVRPVEGSLAANSLIQAPRRTAASVVALMLSLALVVAFEGMGRSNYDSMMDWMHSVLNPDLFVLPSQSLDVRTARFPASMEQELAAVPGISRVQMLRNGRTTFRGKPTMVLALEMNSIGETIQRTPIAGRADQMYRKAAAGEGLIISANLSELQGVKYGDVLEVSAPYGVIRLPVVGIIIDYSDQQGSIMLDRSVFVRYWHDDAVNMYRVYVDHNEKIFDVRERILRRYANQRQVFVLTNDELTAYIRRVLDQWFRLTTVQIAVAVLVAILGIINTLTVSITDRRRELGVLRAIGGLPTQIRHGVWLEAVTIGMFGLVLGSAFGALNLYYLLQVVRTDVTGMRLDYVFPLNTMLLLMPVILGAAFVAALWPAESAVRMSLVEALEYE
jgi:putative ABC transport system permease protein